MVIGVNLPPHTAMNMLTTHSRTGRQLMVLDDAETIARQARRRAATARRRRESLQVASAVAVLGSLAAVIMGVPVLKVLVAMVVLVGLVAVGYQRLHEHLELQRIQRVRANPGRGIGAPRPKGGFSTTRHRTGAPVWIDRHAA
jgi:hypothetical protein